MSDRATARRAPYADLAIFVPLFALYGFIVQFGSLGRFSAAEGAFGLSTIILLVIAVAGAFRAALSMLAIPAVTLLATLVAYLILASFFAPVGSREALVKTPLLVGYLLGCAVAAGLQWTRPTLSFLWVAIALGLLLSATLTVVDYVGIVSIPGNNELQLDSKLGEYRVEQASGFFPRRSAMAAVFSISITGSLILSMGPGGALMRLFFLAAGTTGVVCLFLTHNRSGILGSLIVVTIYGLVSGRFAGWNRLAYGALAFFLGVVLFGVLAFFFPDHLEVYAVKLGIAAGYEEQAASDYLRVALVGTVLKSLLANPIGNGLTLVYFGNGFAKDVHNTVFYLVWAAGLFGVLWIIAFAIACYHRIASVATRPRYPAYDAALWALAAWLMHGMTHNSLNTGIAWILLGVVLSRSAASLGVGRKSAPVEAPDRHRPLGHPQPVRS